MKPLEYILDIDQFTALMGEGNYALNYLAVTPEANGIDKDKLIGELADKIEDDLKDYSFFQQPQAALIAQRERGKIPKDPEEKFIKLSP